LKEISNELAGKPNEGDNDNAKFEILAQKEKEI